MKWILLTCSANVFAAGYLLPNGTILYDTNAQDDTIYKVEKLSRQSQSLSEPAVPQNTVEIVRQAQPTTVVIEGSPIVYERPVMIRERYAYGNPVYDIVDTAGAILVYGLLYDSLSHGFFHPELHHGMPHHRFHR